MVGCVATTEELLVSAMECEKGIQQPVIIDGIVQVKNGEAIMEAVQTEDCKPLWVSWNDAENRKMKREAWEALKKCPKGQVFWCQDRWCRTTGPRVFPRGRSDWVRSGCVDRRDAMDAMGMGGFN